MVTRRHDEPAEVSDASPEDGERSARPWPYWMMRCLGSDEPGAMEDLMWSVGGSPPYGGVSSDEATAVYELLEAYSGPHTAGEAAYAKLRKALKSRPDRLAVLDAFHCADEIQSAPDSYGREPADRGLALARQLRHRGAEASFLNFLGGWLFRHGEEAAAGAKSLEALEIYLDLVDRDPVYELRVKQSAQNAISMTATGGDLPHARDLLQRLSSVLDPEMADQLRRALQGRR